MKLDNLQPRNLKDAGQLDQPYKVRNANREELRLEVTLLQKKVTELEAQVESYKQGDSILISALMQKIMTTAEKRELATLLNTLDRRLRDS